jgi:hypothetical protein
MKVSELVNRLQEFDPDANVYVQVDSRCFGSPVWVGIMDTAGLFDEEEQFQLVISLWEPQDYSKPTSDAQLLRKKALAELTAYDQEIGLSHDENAEGKNNN